MLGTQGTGWHPLGTQVAHLASSEPCHLVPAKTFGFNFTHPSLTPPITRSAIPEVFQYFLAILSSS